MTLGPYATPRALRRALEDRLKARAEERGEDLSRLRRLVAFDRVLARLFAPGGDAPWIVKGGFGLEVRYSLRARTTKDIDLALPITSATTGLAQDLAAVRDQLQEAAERDIGDGFVIAIGAAQREIDGPPEGGARFPVRVSLDGRDFTSFHLDVGIGDPVVEPPEWVTGEEFLSFAGIPAARFALLPIAQQFAEKVHAYTRPRPAPNSRAQDLVDLILVIEASAPDPEPLGRALRATFARLATHRMPETLAAPPETWAEPYGRMAHEVGLAARDLAAAHQVLTRVWSTLDLEGS